MNRETECTCWCSLDWCPVGCDVPSLMETPKEALQLFVECEAV